MGNWYCIECKGYHPHSWLYSLGQCRVADAWHVAAEDVDFGYEDELILHAMLLPPIVKPEPEYNIIRACGCKAIHHSPTAGFCLSCQQSERTYV